MNFVRTIWRRLGALGKRPAVKREIDEELRFHLEQRTAENIASGMSPEKAAREARKRFGNMQSVREECRDVRGASLCEETWKDIRFGARMLRKNPGFTAVALLTLTLAIGANTTMFSMVNLILFRPLPLPDSERLTRIYRISTVSPRDGHSIGVFMDIREQNTVFERVAAYYPEWPYNLAEPGTPAELLAGMLVTSDFFSTLGVQPELGRGFTAAEDQPGSDGVIILSHQLWQRRFNGDTNILGRTLHLDGQNVTVVGVMPARFYDPILWGKMDLLHPFAFGANQRQSRGDNWRFALGRLKPGVSIAQADAELKALAGRFSKEHPKTEAGYGLRALSLRKSMSEEDGPIMWFSLGLAGFVLLIACANLANLLMARLAGRLHELGVRVALGAGRARLFRQLLAESLLLSLIGGAFGFLLAVWANQLIGSRLTIAGETGLPIPLDGRVVAFTLLCCVVAVVLFGTAPAWLTARKDVNRLLMEGSRGNFSGARPHRWRRALIIGEVALALVLLTGAGLFVRGLHQFAQRDPGWRVDGLMTGQLDITSAKYKTPDQRRLFFRELQDRIGALPGVQNVAFSSRPPVLGSRMRRNIAIEGQPSAASGQNFFAGLEPVSAGYFETVGIRLEAGRLFTAADTADQPPIVIINEGMARRCWPNESPIGKRISDADSEKPVWEEIVGVVADVRSPGEIGDSEPQPRTYRPLAQDTPNFAHVEIRFNGAAESAAAALRSAVAGIDPEQSIYKIITAREFIRRELNDMSLLGELLVAFAGLGLSLAAIGIYGVISYAVAQRAGEFGLRLALGARRRDVLWLVLRQGLGQSLLGVLVGFVGALGIARALASILPFPMGNNLVTFIGIGFVLITIALLACFIPACRASRIDPMTALRCQ